MAPRHVDNVGHRLHFSRTTMLTMALGLLMSVALTIVSGRYSAWFLAITSSIASLLFGFALLAIVLIRHWRRTGGWSKH